jgi:hypothetical protein
MLESLYRKLRPKAGWGTVVLLFFGLMLFFNLFQLRNKLLGCEDRTLDMKLLYGSGRADESFRFLKSVVYQDFPLRGVNGLELYAISEWTLDLVFPFVYGFLFIFLLIRLYPAGKAEKLIVLPVLIGLLDFGENAAIAYLALTFDETVSSLVYLASALTAAKIIVLIVCLIALIAGAINSIRRGDS